MAMRTRPAMKKMLCKRFIVNQQKTALEFIDKRDSI